MTIQNSLWKLAVRTLVALLLMAATWSTTSANAQVDCRDTLEGRICSVQQPLVGGALVATEMQRALGLVTITRGCSGTLLNRYWVLTADHCITTDGKPGGPSLDPGSLVIGAAWTGRTASPSKLVRFAPTHGLDVALVFLGNGDLGPAPVQLLFVGEVDVDQTITAYGRGISMLATGTGPSDAVASFQDGLYRSARFQVSAASATAISFDVNTAGQIIAGGDSGGPDIVTAPNGIGIGLVGVHSTCWATYVPGMPTNGWAWANAISRCTSAAIADIRFEILQTIQEGPGQFIGTFSQTPTNDVPVFLYAERNDGTLLWYRKDTSSSPWQGPRTVGTGWQGFKDVIPAGGNRVFALRPDGGLLWYQHNGFNTGTLDWAGPVQVGTGWSFAKIFGGSDGVVYAVRQDGTLLWYYNAGFETGASAWSGPSVVGSGWAGFKDVFSVGGGIVYAVQQDGTLLWYKHEGFRTGAATWTGPRRVGTGWQNFVKIVPVGEGVLLAIGEHGELLWYKHTDYLTGTTPGTASGDRFSAGTPYTGTAHWEGPIGVGTGWQGFRTVFAILPATPVPPR